LGKDFTVQGGGYDLVFPHHELSGGHASALSGHRLAQVYSHAGLVAYQGEKMSKSLGNLVLVSRLRESGVDPRAIRLTILAHHYRSNWEWTDAVLADATDRLERWSAAVAASAETSDDGPVQSVSATAIIADVRMALNNDLDTPAALRILDGALAQRIDEPRLIVNAIKALLGVAL
jgi:L-cysteine:1D-myo-inositol 2-amino-2-deoxy-alpha-D-glucopyranoside ligase